MRIVRVIVCRVGQAPTAEQMADDVDAMQKFVGGYFRAKDMRRDAAGRWQCIYREDDDAPPNRFVPFERPTTDWWLNIRGDFVVCRVDSAGELVDVSDDAETARYLSIFTVSSRGVSS